jgi:hypothetical protein
VVKQWTDVWVWYAYYHAGLHWTRTTAEGERHDYAPTEAPHTGDVVKSISISWYAATYPFMGANRPH